MSKMTLLLYQLHGVAQMLRVFERFERWFNNQYSDQFEIAVMPELNENQSCGS